MFAFGILNKGEKMKIKKSTIVLIVILLLYTVLSFWKLGDNKNPQTFVNLKNGKQLTYKLEGDKIPKKIKMYVGYDESYVSIFLADEYMNYETYTYDVSQAADYANVLDWAEFEINSESNKCSYIVLQSYWDTTVLGEFKVYDENGNEILLTPMGDEEKILIDEQDTVPTKISYMNGSYFDEVYFPRTVYEGLHDLPIYEYTHPPLGKLIMSIPVYFFGLTPFAYRLMGNIAGILMILVIYAIAKTLFKEEKYALFAAAIMALDGMHFVQTRIGTVDSFLVLFSLTSFLFFLKYLAIEKEEPLKKKMMPLLLAGIFWGMAISVKWTAAFVRIRNGDHLCC